MDTRTFDKYYKNVLIDEVKKFQDFKLTHVLKKVFINERFIEYYCCGKGGETILLFHGIAETAEFTFRAILKLEKDFKIIAPTITHFETIDEFNNTVNRILEMEKIENVCLLESTMGDFFSLHYFYKNLQKIRGIVTSSSFKFTQGLPVKFYLKLFPFVPFVIIRRVIKKNIYKLFPLDLPLKMNDRVDFLKALFNETLNKRINRKILYSHLKLASIKNHKDSNGLKHWNGKKLIIRESADNHLKNGDNPEVKSANIRIFYLPIGTAPLTTLLCEDSYINIIKNFFSSL